MTARLGRWRWLAGLGGLLAVVALPLAVAQPPNAFNEREVKREVNIQDKDGVWVFDFRFKDPRLIKVDIPGRGQRVVWYMWYQVINNTGEPRTFIPKFELVTQDSHKNYTDEVLPKAQEAIAALEDPTSPAEDRLKRLKNSVTIGSDPIPPSNPDSAPKKVTGVAIWDGVDPDTTSFSVFVSGLSNGWSVDDNGVVRRKTLQLNFQRTGSRYVMRSEDIKFVPPAAWIYRNTDIKVSDAAKPQK
jgi:hypothetical protein